MKGYVYVLSNESMPGIVKIGRSIHGGRGRANTFYKNDTGVPTPFVLEFEMMFDDCVAAERAAHIALKSKRINPNREFFRIKVGLIKRFLLDLAADEIGGKVIDKSYICLEPEASVYKKNARGYETFLFQTGEDFLFHAESAGLQLLRKHSRDFRSLIVESYTRSGETPPVEILWDESPDNVVVLRGVKK